MNKDKFIAFRVSNAEYEVIKNKSKIQCLRKR